ncbi:hypothetical protein CL615_04050 [archaeon]|jgi:cytochrome c-type biogenesis protein|nr:hypothetical protein [archaeon]|tara:strand:+ start:56143 stop:57129 length:987 start_codon:yes stop_codon:yes gene_type:complete
MELLNENKKIFVLLLAVFFLMAFSFSVSSQSDFPIGLQKILDYNNNQADFYFKNISFIIAFLAGIISIISPCSLGILPAFFAYTFEERKQITKSTFAFFLGFMPVFVALGLIATFIGSTITELQQNNRLLVTIAGLFIIAMGVMAFFGKGFTFIKTKGKIKNNAIGLFLYGIFFAIGWTACTGPIVVGILLIASILNNYIYSAFLMFFYSLGIFVPLFLMSFLFDKYNFSKSKFIQGKELEFTVFNKKIRVHSTNLIAAILFIALGLVFVIYGGTYITNNLGLGSMTSIVYSFQEKVLSLKLSNIIGVVILLVFLFLLYRFLKKNGNK